MEVTNRFKGLDLVDKMPKNLWLEAHNIVQEVVTKTIPKKKKCTKAKWLSEEALKIAEKSSKSQRKTIRISIFFAAENGEALYSQQKQDLELTVAQIISSLL